ncbi:BRCA2, oligonucleotide/oligosaccharide-binding, domain 1-domain-containing protein [Pilobolus umbonatus]|nr:BRCA2, oligonucleotide/oligosaccharide-binding, domain 1-domain-containing protein [Pilobolus umbonatus]
MNLGHRPVLRKVLEQDDVSIKHMVLVISDIISIKTPVHAYTSSKYLLQLTDGWYTVFACIDERMERTIQQNRLHIGHKLSICGSQLVGDKTPQSPLMIQRETMLHITTNGCLPVPWDTKLGYHPRKLVPRDLGSLFEDGGTVTVIDIIVCRKYPILFTETLSDGTTITRTAKEEEAFRRPFETVQERKVAGYFRVRMCDHHKSSDEWATLLLVNASEIHHLDVVEGNRYRVFFITPYLPRVKRYPGMHFKTSRMTRWESVQVNKDVKNTYIPRFISSCGSIKKSKESSQTEFDVVVFILRKVFFSVSAYCLFSHLLFL